MSVEDIDTHDFKTQQEKANKLGIGLKIEERYVFYDPETQDGHSRFVGKLGEVNTLDETFDILKGVEELAPRVAQSYFFSVLQVLIAEKEKYNKTLTQ